MTRGKNDAIDAEAICEAADRPSMRFVPVKSVEGQALAMLQRSRDLSIKNRTMLVNALRRHLAEFGFIAAKGMGKLPDLIKVVSEAPKEALPDMARATIPHPQRWESGSPAAALIPIAGCADSLGVHTAVAS